MPIRPRKCWNSAWLARDRVLPVRPGLAGGILVAQQKVGGGHRRLNSEQTSKTETSSLLCKFYYTHLGLCVVFLLRCHDVFVLPRLQSSELGRQIGMAQTFGHW